MEKATHVEKETATGAYGASTPPEVLEPELKELAHIPTDFILPTVEEENAVIRKLDWRLLPYVFLLYTLSVLDRSNLGNAKLAGLANAVNLGGWNYNWLGQYRSGACEKAF